MSLVNKCFKVIEEDDELTMQFPEFKLGTEFKVITVDTANGNPDGIIAVQIKGGDYIHVKSRDSWFWCFYCQDTMNQLEEIEELASDQYKELDLSSKFEGQEISKVLDSMAGDMPDWEQDALNFAADYIRKLEAQLEFSDKAF